MFICICFSKVKNRKRKWNEERSNQSRALKLYLDIIGDTWRHNWQQSYRQMGDKFLEAKRENKWGKWGKKIVYFGIEIFWKHSKNIRDGLLKEKQEEIFEFEQIIVEKQKRKERKKEGGKGRIMRKTLKYNKRKKEFKRR